MFEAYSIGVRISLINHASAGLVALSQAFMRTHSDAEKLEGRIKSIQGMMLKGGAIAVGGAAILGAFKGPLEEAKQFQAEVGKFKALGLGDAVTSDAITFAKGMDIMGQSARDNMVLLREATSIMGDFGHAKEVLPLLAKMKFGIESVMAPGEGSKFEQMFQSAIKVTELRGALVNRDTGQIDPEKFANALNMMTRAYVASGGLVKPQDYLAAIKTGGVSTKLMSDEMFFYGLGHFMQESGGSRTGTASMSLFQNWAMGRMPQRIAEDMAKIGLLDPKAIQYGTTGHVKRVDAMGIKDAQLFVENPFAWVNKIAVPMLQAQGHTGNDLNIALSKLIGIRTGSNLADQFVREEKLAELYVTRSKKAMGIDGLYQTGSDMQTGQVAELHAKYSNLMLELGLIVLPMAIRGLKLLIPVIKDLTEWISRHRTLAKALVIGFLALGGAMAVGGTLTVLIGGFRGLALVLGGFGNLAGLSGGLAGVAGGISALTIAAGAFVAAYAGWRAGGWLGDKANAAAQGATGEKSDTWLGALHDKFNPFNSKTGKREFSLMSAIYGTGDSIKANRALEANYHRIYDTQAKRFLTADEALARDRQSRDAMGKDMSSMLNFGSPYISRSPGQGGGATQGDVYLDGRKVGKVIAPHLAAQLSGPQRGTSGFDSTQMPTPIGIGGL